MEDSYLDYRDCVEEIAYKIRSTFELLQEKNGKYYGKVDLDKAYLLVGSYHVLSDQTEVLGFKVLVTDNLGGYNYMIAIHDPTYVEGKWLEIFHNGF